MRKAGIGHFNAKQKRSKQLAAKKESVFPMTNKERGRFLPNK